MRTNLGVMSDLNADGLAVGGAALRHQDNGGVLILDPAAPLASARRFLSQRYKVGGARTLHHQNAAFYQWAQSHYVERDHEEMRAVLYPYLDEALRETDKGALAPFKPTRAKVANVLEALAAEAQVPRTMRPPAWLDGRATPLAPELIACTNGLLHLATRSLHPHSPHFFTLNALEFAYQTNAPQPVEWLKFLKSIWPNDAEAIATLQEIFGLCLTGDTRYQKAFLVVGPKRSGKGTIARVLTQVLGASNVCGPTLSGLGQNFGLATLIGKRLAIISDARLSGKADQQIIAERLLAITGEDALSIPRKFKEDWTGRLEARFLILTNELPRLTDSSGALASRFVILTMTKSFFGTEDLGMGNRLQAELPGILKWAIDGWARLTQRGYFVPPKSSDAAQADLEDLGSPIGAFLRDRCVIEQGRGIRSEELYNAWRTWCEEQGREHPGSVQTFGRDLCAAVPGLKVEVPRAEDGSRFRYYSGIGLAW